MVCFICNGKGYVIEKGKEMLCPECQGRGEDVAYDRGRLPKVVPHECAEPPCPGAFVG